MEKEINNYVDAVESLKESYGCNKCLIAGICSDKCEDKEALDIIEEFPGKVVRSLEDKYELTDIDDDSTANTKKRLYNMGLYEAVGTVKDIAEGNK